MNAKSVFTTVVGAALLLPSLVFAVDLPKPGLAETNGAVTVGKPAPPMVGTDIKGVFGQWGATYTVIRDEGSKLFEGYGVTLIPSQVVIDRQGIVRKIHNGFNADLETVLGLKELAGLGAAVAR